MGQMDGYDKVKFLEFIRDIFIKTRCSEENWNLIHKQIDDELVKLIKQ